MVYKLNVLGPRGGAKSTLATLAYPLRGALHRRELYIWIISDTAHQARAHLDNLKAELLDNPLIERDYPQATGRGPVWRSEKIVLCNGVTIETFGTGQRARANRPTLLICDDLQNDQYMESTIQRSHTRTWFHDTLLKADCPSTKLLLHQLQEFPIADHDDGPDALEMALRLATEMLAAVPNDGLRNRLPVG